MCHNSILIGYLLVIPSLSCNFIPCQEVDKLEGTELFPVKLGQ